MITHIFNFTNKLIHTRFINTRKRTRTLLYPHPQTNTVRKGDYTIWNKIYSLSPFKKLQIKTLKIEVWGNFGWNEWFKHVIFHFYHLWENLSFQIIRNVCKAIPNPLEFVWKINWSSLTHSDMVGLSVLSILTQRDAKFANIAVDSIV